MAALNFQPTERVPIDLGGMRSTGISAFAYPKLRAALGLPARLPRVYDTGQMLALPDLDVLDALGCDAVTVEGDGLTNAFEQPELWHPYDFNGRLPALVRDPAAYRTDSQGTIHLGDWAQMPASSFVFDGEHGGQPLILEGDLPKPDLKEVRKHLDAGALTDAQIAKTRDNCRRVRASTDRAVFFWGQLNLGLCIHGYGGLAVFPVLCLEEPDFVHELHSLHLEASLRNVRALLPEIKDYVDVVGTDADDWGNQNSLMASPATFREFFLPYRQRHNQEIHRIAPHIKTFLHSCGALYGILDQLVQTGTDILNPVQWPAGGHTPAEWKDAVAGRMSLWGGGVNSQATLPLGSVEDVDREVARTIPVLARQGGYVFCNIHNLLAEVPPEKILAMYRTAARTRCAGKGGC
jgi:uroporphyrinogen decarboxylase